jgi:hypothetical protein
MKRSDTRLDHGEFARRLSPGIARMRLCLPAALLLGLLGGCASGPNDPMAGSYYLNLHKEPRALGRVALVELDNMSTYPEISRDATEALFLELQKKQLFSLARVSQDDPAWPALRENLDSPQGLQTLLEVRERLKCNGLLVGTVTEYRPYPRLVLGLRLKLLDLTDSRLLWGLEQVWDSSDRSMQKRIQAYFKRPLGLGPVPLREQVVVMSPLEFVRFAAYETAQTLEPKRRR